jgi:hypothetical protein
MIRAEVRTDDDILLAIADAAQKSPVLMRTAFSRNVKRLAARYLKPLKKEPPKWRGKRRWKSEKQRRAYFATDGFGSGIPYTRTHELANAWRVEFESGDPYSGVVTFVNDSPAARFVQGDDAQPMHLDSGWPQLADSVSQARPELENVAIETWFSVSDPFAGVRR